MTSVNPGAEPREAGVENATLNNSPGRRNQTPMPEETRLDAAFLWRGRAIFTGSGLTINARMPPDLIWSNSFRSAKML
jgi:hypothetical protein